MQTTVFTATKDSVVLKVSDIHAGNVITVRDGLLPEQAKRLAARLTRNAGDTEEYKPTRREQKFAIHFEGDFECVSCKDQDEVGFFSVKQAQKEVQQQLVDVFDTDFDFGYQKDGGKVKVTVTKVYDKQVPNE